MSIFSREIEYAGVFEEILKIPDWTSPGLPEFKFYMEQHIALDSCDGGHKDLTSEFIVDERVRSFYEARLNSYKAIPKLFEENSRVA